METEKKTETKPVKPVIHRHANGAYKKGSSGNIAGRPPGKSLKEFWRSRFASMTDKQKEKFSKKVSPELLYRMAEGNPSNATDVTSDNKQIIFNISKEIAEKNDVDSTQSSEDGS